MNFDDYPVYQDLKKLWRDNVSSRLLREQVRSGEHATAFPKMKPKTRDNLIYLAVGLSIAALVTADAFYADSRGRKMWWPSRFAFRAVTTPSLLACFVVKEMRREKARLLQTFAAVLLATLLQLGIMFGFRQVIDQLPGMSYSALAVVELFVVWQLSVRGVLYVTSSHRAD